MSKGPPPEGYDDNPEWTEEDFARAMPADQLPPQVLSALVKRPRGRPVGTTKPDTKQPVTLRLDPDVIEKFKATGRGWQGRINEVLRNARP